MAEKPRDFNQPIDVALLDATVATFYGTGSKEEVGIIHFLPRLVSSFCLVSFGFTSVIWLVATEFERLSWDFFFFYYVCGGKSWGRILMHAFSVIIRVLIP